MGIPSYRTDPAHLVRTKPVLHSNGPYTRTGPRQDDAGTRFTGPMAPIGSLLHLCFQCPLQRRRAGFRVTADYNPDATALPIRLAPPSLRKLRIQGGSSTEHPLGVFCLVQAGSALLYLCLRAPKLLSLGR